MAFSIPFLPRPSRKSASPRMSLTERHATEREAVINAWAGAVLNEPDADLDAARAVERWAYSTERPVTMMTLWARYNDLRFAGVGILRSRD